MPGCSSPAPSQQLCNLRSIAPGFHQALSQAIFGGQLPAQVLQIECEEPGGALLDRDAVSLQARHKTSAHTDG